LTRKLLEKEPLGRYMRRRKDMKLHPMETRCENMDWNGTEWGLLCKWW